MALVMAGVMEKLWTRKFTRTLNSTEKSCMFHVYIDDL